MQAHRVTGCAVLALVLAGGCTTHRGQDSNVQAKPSVSQTTLSSLPTASSAQTSAAAAAAAAGVGTCASAKPAALGWTDHEIAVKGAAARKYIRYLPESYDGRRRLPVVFNFHGYSANAEEQLLYSGLVSVSDRIGFAVVTLNGQGDPKHYNQRATEHDGEVSDISVVTRLLDELSATLCLDQRRVYATGMSDGGALAAALGCFASTRFAAVAPVAALIYDPSCDKGKPVPLMAFRGTADKIVPYAGGTVACCGNPVVNPTKVDITSWAKHNGCASRPAVTRHGDVETTAYTGCTAGADVVLQSVIGGGHTWPGAIGLPGLGHTSRDINASQAMWEFFAAHPKP